VSLLQTLVVITTDCRVHSLIVIARRLLQIGPSYDGDRLILTLRHGVAGLWALTEYHVLFRFRIVHIHHYLLILLLLSHLKPNLLVLLVVHFVKRVSHSRRRRVIVVLRGRWDIDILTILLMRVRLVGRVTHNLIHYMRPRYVHFANLIRNFTFLFWG